MKFIKCLTQSGGSYGAPNFYAAYCRCNTLDLSLPKACYTFILWFDIKRNELVGSYFHINGFHIESHDKNYETKGAFTDIKRFVKDEDYGGYYLTPHKTINSFTNFDFLSYQKVLSKVEMITAFS